MPFQPTKTLTAFFMEESLKRATQASSSLGQFLFTPSIELFQLIMVCLDAYVKGVVLGSSFKDEADLLVQMMVAPDNVQEHTEHLHSLAKGRLDSYGRDVDSLMDFFVYTELAKDGLDFDALLKKARTKIKLYAAGARVKLSFEEGVLFGARYPQIASKALSSQSSILSSDLDKARMQGLSPSIEARELELNFLERLTTHNLQRYVAEYFPEFKEPLKL